jgi:hypothetical protein
MARVKTKATTATAAEMVRQFSHFSDLSLTKPVFVTKNGRARNVLLSLEEYQRLKSRDRVAVRAADIPDVFIPQLEALARSKKRR